MSKDASKDANGDGANEDWKRRPPYKVHDNDPGFKVYYEGSCHCKRVQFQLGREKPLDAKYCHCTTCQVLHGAPFQWASIFHKEDLNFTKGHHELGWYDSAEKTTRHKLPCKVSCAYCRTPIMDEGRNMILLFPTLLHFKNKQEQEKFKPSCHMFYSRRVVDIMDGIPKWTGMNDDSDRLNDDGSPMDARKKRKVENGGEEKE